MKILKLINILILLSLNIYSQNKQGKVPYMTKSDIDKYVVVDTASVRIWYALNALDIEDEQSYLDLQRLEIGKTRNKYYSYYVWESDSLITVYQRHSRSGNYPSQFFRPLFVLFLHHPWVHDNHLSL